MATTYLSKTPSSAGNRKTWTWSGWVKRSGFDASNNMVLWSSYEDANNRLSLQITNTDQFQCYALEGGTLTARIVSERLLRDVNSWYHFVYILDTTQATATDRQKLYVNGELADIVSSSRVDPSQNADLAINDTQVHTIGTQNTSNYFDGAMAHVNFIDGTSYAASTFGETDSTTGEWKPKTAPSVTYGTNGFFLKFENASTFGEDSSGNDNDFTSNGSPTQLVDTPANVLATQNILTNPAQVTNGNTFSNGSNTCTFSTAAGTFPSHLATLGFTKGKWYWEVKHTGGDSVGVGVYTDVQSLTVDYGGTPSSLSGSTLIQTGGNEVHILENAGKTSNVVTGLTSPNIIGIAFDADNGKLFFYVNGTEPSGQDISAGTSLCDTLSTGQLRLPAFYHGDGGSGTKTGTLDSNFGNGYFGTTAVTSGNQDDAGYGTFEYDVPTGYYTLNTKNINTYG